MKQLHTPTSSTDVLHDAKGSYSKTCRFCGNDLKIVFVNLGMSPLSNAYLRPDQEEHAETFYPLTAYVCSACYLVQLMQYESPEIIFSDYAYFSSYSDSWLEHARQYVHMVCERFRLDGSSLVVELASNDGYLLQYFIQKRIPVLGIEPAENVAQVAKDKGIPTEVEFFGKKLAQRLVDAGKSADLLIGNNVLAHVPDINDFVGGMKLLLKPTGVITMEFPHLLQLIRNVQFDTIYHEHFSYFSLYSVEKVFSHHGLKIFDVEELPTHGGSLRIYATHSHVPAIPVTDRVHRIGIIEAEEGITNIETYLTFGERVKKIKRALLKELINIKDAGKTIAAYGAAAKGNTLLNYCGIRTDFIEYVVDRNPHKVGKILPGTHIPIKPIDYLREYPPDYLIILPWNLKDEIIEQTSYLRTWGGRYIIPIPDLQIID